jgi:hypothetical protein
MTFAHIAPGIVRTPLAKGLTNSHWSGRILTPLTDALGHLIGKSADECAEYMWRGLYASQKGYFRYSQYGEEVGDKNLHSTPESKQKVWEHTLEETSR